MYVHIHRDSSLSLLFFYNGVNFRRREAGDSSRGRVRELFCSTRGLANLCDQQLTFPLSSASDGTEIE